MKTFGRLNFKGKWFITCEPHVSLRLKRVFAQIGKWQQGGIVLSDTLDTARDIEWFIDRYPLEMSEEVRRILQDRAAKHVEQSSLVDGILAGNVVPQPVEVARPLYPFQAIASELAYVKKRLLLGDDVGLGKTTSAIGLIVRPECRPAVVVTLTHLPRQWRSEVGIVAPQLRTHIIKKTTIYDIVDDPLFGVPDVILISYSKLHAWAETLAKIAKTVIFDEVQELRHRGTDKSRAGNHLAHTVEWSMGLSATPFYNYGGEMFSVMDCLCPGAMGSWDEFNNEWCVNSFQENKIKIKNPKAFGMYLRDSGMMLRRTRHDVDRELPGVTPLKIPQIVESDKKVLDQISSSCAELAASIMRSTELYRGEKMQVSEEFSMRLRQATGIAKAPYVAEFVRLLVESGEKIVLYGWHREVYSIWMDKLKDLKPSLYSGSESIPQKEEAKRRFVDGETDVLIISLRSGQGLDGLQYHSRTIVIGELDWSPGVIEQCIGRVYRDGQKDRVAVYYMLSEAGADPFMSEVLGMKRQQIDSVRDVNTDLIEELQLDGGHIKKMAEAYLEKHRLSTNFLEGAREEVEEVSS